MNITKSEEVVPITPQAFHVLLALAEKPMYAYGIVEQCRADAGTDVRFDHGGTYRLVRRLLKAGHIREAFESESRGSAHARKYLELTSTGELVLKFEADRYHSAAALGRYRLNRRAKYQEEAYI